jgi:hypothetical protein
MAWVGLALGLLCLLAPEALAQELRVVRHLVARDIKGDGTPVLGSNFMFDDERAVSWVQLDGTLELQALRWEFIDPKGHLYATEQHQVGTSKIHWAWIFIRGTIASKIIGQWTVKFYIDREAQFEDKFTITTVDSPPGDGGSGLKVVRHLIARDIKGDGTPVTGERFMFDDERAVSWVQLDGTFELQALRWEFIDPKGHLYATEQHQVGTSKIHWAWIFIRGTIASKIIGQWTVKFYIDGQLQFEDKFKITTKAAPSPFVVCAAGGDGFFDSEEALVIIKAWNEGQEYGSCGKPSESDLLEILRLWAQGEPVPSSATLQANWERQKPLQVSQARTHEGGVLIASGDQKILSLEVKVFDLQGDLLLQETATGNQLRLSTTSLLSNGVYLYTVRARSANGKILQSRIQRLVIAH